ncbi:MAG TPA: transporter substrate-binding domain-containing protein [Ramlibacter sp.]|nr:transporter substrate-binding domain-containing protein [Ramlibacter sp.]
MFFRMLARRALLFALAFAGMQFCLGTSAWAGPTLVRVGVYQNAPEVDFAPDGRAQGIFVEVLDAIARSRGWSIEYVRGSFAEGLERLQGGRLDLMASVALTPARAKVLAFHQEPLVHTWAQVYAPRGSGIRTILDLSGKRVALLDGSVQQTFFAQLVRDFDTNVTALPFKDNPSAMAAVLRGDADAFVPTASYGRYSARPAGLEDTAIIFAPMALYFAGAPGGDPALLEAIDTSLRSMKADPRSVYFESLGRWTKQGNPPTLPAWVSWAVAAGALVMAMLAAWAATLRRAAAKLRASEQQQRFLAEELTHIFDQSRDAICVMDSQMRFARVGRACERLWGYTPQEMQGRSVLEFVPAQYHDAAIAEITKVRDGTPTHNLAAQSLCKDGSRGSIIWSGVWSDVRQEMYWIGRDDTERRRLIANLHARTAELERANHELQTFSHSVSHDLRAPVSTVVGFVGKVVRDQGAALPEASLSLLKRSIAAAQRMDQIIEDLLSLAQISQLGIHRRPCDLTGIATDAAQALRNPHGSNLRLTVQPGVQVSADPRLLRLALDNLMGNAFKFTSRVSEPSVEVGREEGAADEVFFVRDNGAGFDMEHAANKLFRPFQRMHSQQEFEGTGIGLSIVHRVVTRHGGTIWAQSRPGEGAVFRFTLAPPRGEAAARADVTAP